MKYILYIPVTLRKQIEHFRIVHNSFSERRCENRYGVCNRLHQEIIVYGKGVGHFGDEVIIWLQLD